MEIAYQILILLCFHWIADFLLQTEAMGKNKSSDERILFIHCLIYSFVMSFGFVIVTNNIYGAIMFFALTLITHYVTDYYTSRWTKRLREKEKYYGFIGFFPAIGLDQLIHQAQIIICLILFAEF